MNQLKRFYLINSISLGPINFHLYGLIHGLAILVGIWLSERKALQQGVKSEDWWRVAMLLLAGGLIGARLSYVGLNWSYYARDWQQVWAIWQGGLNIVGGMVGSVLSLWLANWLSFTKHLFKVKPVKVLDLAVFGLPFAQALGRWGNFFNQELYGLPSQLPWAIYIAPEQRAAGYEKFATFHPLFLYESLLMLSFGFFVWGFSSGKDSVVKIGSGWWFLTYIIYYSIIRILLEFIRINKTHLISTNLSITQGFLLIVLLVALFMVIIRKITKR